MALSEAKLKNAVGNVRLATADEITNAGAIAGYASPIGLKNVIIIVDDLIPHSSNLAAGANEAGYHFKNTNCGRDYSAKIITDLVQAKAGDVCINCGNALEIVAVRAFGLAQVDPVHFRFRGGAVEHGEFALVIDDARVADCVALPVALRAGL